MTELAHTPTNESPPQQSENDISQDTPRISSASPASGSKEDNAQDIGYLAKAGEYMPQGITTSFFKKPPSAENPASPHSSTAADDEDDTGSTTTDLTELSTTAQAGSVAPSSPPSPAPSTELELESSGVGENDNSEDREKSDADASPFLHDDHSSAKKPSPPQINLAPRTHPLAGGEAEHGGFLLREERQAELDDERAQGTREPAYDDAPEFKPNFEEDRYSSDEASDEANGGKMKKLKKRITRRTITLIVRRVKGEAKLLSGRIRRDEEKVEEGKRMINTT
ncbi:hypothetical protein C8F04DRAFT_1102649 [Mycena alexandri]|uniref:Uncharacterized protein n=1 Tax=Mycena alexandri TaxID=1745969 RepID=A0AAD6X466_9AGAR|nr:hypothetical protein C8F04DRAFT_1102649 [Mycena alexandri]